MLHIPIINPTHPDMRLEFSHINRDAEKGAWKKERIITNTGIKINVFLEGTFSIFSDGVSNRPTYGDICFLPPMKMHCGHISEPMHINYYQLDIGLDAFSSIPDGDKLIKRLLDVTATRQSFVRPSSQKKDEILALCREIEAAIKREELYLAYAKVIEFLSFLYTLYLSDANLSSVAFPMRAAQAIRYIEKNFAENLTLKELSAYIGVSPSFLSRTFKKEIGISVLKSTELPRTRSVTEVGYLCGFCDNSHFITVFKKHMGITPMQYKKQYSS